VAAYQILGELLFEKGEKDKATECFKRGLEMASNEVVSRVETISDNE
jgi:HemY protein